MILISTVIRPTRPVNISSTITIFDAPQRLEVIPIVEPTVLIADTTSNKIERAERVGSIDKRVTKPTTIAMIEAVTTAEARRTDSAGISRPRSVVALRPRITARRLAIITAMVLILTPPAVD